MNIKAVMAAIGVIVFIGINSDAFGNNIEKPGLSSKKLDTYGVSKF